MAQERYADDLEGDGYHGGRPAGSGEEGAEPRQQEGEREGAEGQAPQDTRREPLPPEGSPEEQGPLKKRNPGPDPAVLAQERQSIQRYVNWLQQVDLGAGRKLLKTTRGRGSRQEPCSIMTNLGQKPEDQAGSATLFAKVRKLGPARVSFELVNCYTGLRYFGEADMDESTFPFASKDIATAFDGVPNAWCNVEDFGKGSVLTLKGAGYLFKQHTEDTAEKGDELMIEAGGTPDATTATDDTPKPPIEDDTQPTNGGDDEIAASITPQQQPAPPQPPVRIEETPQYQELQNKLRSLRAEITSLNAQLIVAKVENSITEDTLNKMSSKKPTRFDIKEYSLRKFISQSYNGRLYGVEHSSGKCHVLKEIISLEGEINNDVKNVTIANELALLDSMRTNSPENLLHIEEVQIEHTPLRKSHYLLSEPAAFALEEFANTNLRNCDQVVPYIIGAQILSGLIFLKQRAKRVHGNLSCNSVLVDFSGTIKLSCFEFVFPIGTPVEPTLLLADVSSVRYKHTQILESRDRAQTVPVLPVMDIWSVACIMFRLLNGGDLFIGAPTVEMRLSTAGRAYEPHVRECVGDLFAGYYSNIQPEAVLQRNVFAGLEKEKVTNHYKPALQ